MRADQPTTNLIGDGDDFVTLLDERGFDTSQISAVGVGSTEFEGRIRQPGGEFENYPIHGIDQSMIENSVSPVPGACRGHHDDAAIIEALRSDPTVAVIDQGALGGQDDFGEEGDSFSLGDPDGDGPEEALDTDDETFAPIQIEIETANGDVVPLTIIGIIDQKVGSLFGLFAQAEVIDQAYPDPQLISYFVQLQDSDTAEQAAKDIEQALLINGVQAVFIDEELEDQQQQSRAFLYIIQGFMGSAW